MAVFFKCDGCGAAVENPARVGHVIIRDYCRECSEKADAYVKAEEGLRKALHEKFIDDRAALIAQYQNFKLPDIP